LLSFPWSDLKSPLAHLLHLQKIFAFYFSEFYSSHLRKTPLPDFIDVSKNLAVVDPDTSPLSSPHQEKLHFILGCAIVLLLDNRK